MSASRPPLRERLRAAVAHAFAVPAARPLEADDAALLDRIATACVRRGLGEAAIFALASSAPLSFLGSQMMAFARPFYDEKLMNPAARVIGRAVFGANDARLFSEAEYERLQSILERRDAADLLAAKIESRLQPGAPAGPGESP